MDSKAQAPASRKAVMIGAARFQNRDRAFGGIGLDFLHVAREGAQRHVVVFVAARRHLDARLPVLW